MDPDRAAFVTFLRALGPARDHVVVIGGWAHRLFALHPLARRTPQEPITTLDVDVALPEHGAIPVNVDERLRRGGLEVERVGRETPQLTRYHVRGANAGAAVYAEFLVPRSGAAVGRRATGHTTEVAGVVAQRLPHVDLLLEAPWTVVLDRGAGYPVEDEAVRVAIPNAARYLAQKLVVLEQRPVRGKRANDVRYIHDTIQRFGDALGSLADLAAEIRWPREGRRRLERGRRLLHHPDLLARAARIPDRAGRTVSAEALRDAIEDGLSTIFW